MIKMGYDQYLFNPPLTKIGQNAPSSSDPKGHGLGRQGKEGLQKTYHFIYDAFAAVGKRPSAVRQAHGPELSRRAALPSSLVTAADFYVRLIPRDFGSLAAGHFPPAFQKQVFRQSL